MEDARTPDEIREGVREALLTSLARDYEMIGGRTARRLMVAGVGGTVGAVGMTLLVSGHHLGEHPPQHLSIFSSVWAGLLVVALALGLLGVRTPRLALGQAAIVGVVGLALAAFCSFLCANQHFLVWWGETAIGEWLLGIAGFRASTLCFGLLTSLFFGVVAALMVFPKERARQPKPLLPAAMIVVLLASWHCHWCLSRRGRRALYPFSSPKVLTRLSLAAHHAPRDARFPPARYLRELRFGEGVTFWEARGPRDGVSKTSGARDRPGASAVGSASPDLVPSVTH
jgi:hypothetical protein